MPEIPWAYVDKVICNECGQKLTPDTPRKIPNHLPPKAKTAKDCKGSGQRPGLVIGFDQQVHDY